MDLISDRGHLGIRGYTPAIDFGGHGITGDIWFLYALLRASANCSCIVERDERYPLLRPVSVKSAKV